jgi:hypothetical protein
MSSVEISVEGFRCHFPEFILATYSDETVCRYLCQAEAYCSTTNFRIRPKVRVLLIYLMTAHLITLAGINSSNGLATNAGDITGFETSASIDGVSVSKQAPIARNAFEQWINSTGYGQQYWAMLTANVPTPIHYVGNPETFGIR